MTRAKYSRVNFLSFVIIICILAYKTWAQETTPEEKNHENNQHQTEPRKGQPNHTFVPKRLLGAARTQQGSIHQGLRSDYLVTVTLPWTLGMFFFIIFLLMCMRIDGWLYHLFTDDYMPPAVKKQMEEEARRTEGKKARMERVDNWDEIQKTWENDLNECKERVRATMPANMPPTMH